MVWVYYSAAAFFFGSFFGGGVAAHVSTARPVSAALVGAVQAAAERIGVPVHRGLTYACVEGPRLGTQAESHFLRQAGCHLVGMTNVPEAFLAREAQMAYATVGLVTDYDCWHEGHGAVDVAQVIAVLTRNAGTAKAMDHEHYCWMNAAYVMGARLTDAFAALTAALPPTRSMLLVVGRKG